MKQQKRPLFLLFEGLIITPQFGWYTELAHCRQYLLFSRSVVISSQGRREAIKSNCLQLKFYRVDEYEFPSFKTNGFYSDKMNKSRS